MVRITEALLRKRSEHNEGMLTNLEEISMHQEEIEKIEFLDVYCRHLQILLLQNNIIEKIENLSKLKELRYLNLALNNIAKIENLEGNESLVKLDLTANFIEAENLEESLYNLKKVASIRELYFMGNPCTDWKGCRALTVAIVDQLATYDGSEITKSERIKAKQQFDELMEDLEKFIAEEKKKLKNNDENAYTRESRKKMYMDVAKEKEEEQNRKNPPKPPKEITPTHWPNGDIRQCNEGKYEFHLDEWSEPEFSLFELRIPKYLDTSFMQVQLDPKFVSVRVKDKLTQLRLAEEIVVEKSIIQRSQTTGVLHIKMQKITPTFKIEKNEVNKPGTAGFNPKTGDEIKVVKETVIEEAKNENESSAKAKAEAAEKAKKALLSDPALEDLPELE